MSIPKTKLTLSVPRTPKTSSPSIGLPPVSEPLLTDVRVRITNDSLDHFQADFKTSKKAFDFQLSIDPDNAELTPASRRALIDFAPRDRTIDHYYSGGVIEPGETRDKGFDKLVERISATQLTIAQREAKWAGEMREQFADTASAIERIVTAINNEMVLIQDPGAVERFIASQGPVKSVEVYEVLRYKALQALYPDFAAFQAQYILEGFEFIDANRMPKAMLLSGKPSRSSIDIDLFKEAGADYFTIIADQALNVWLSQISRATDEKSTPPETEATEKLLVRMAEMVDAASARLHQRRVLAEEAARQKPIPYVKKVNSILDDEAITLALELGFDPTPATVDAAEKWWLSATSAITKAHGGMAPSFHTNDELEDSKDEAELSLSSSPSVNTMRAIKALKELMMTKHAEVINGDSKPRITVFSETSQGKVIAEHIQIDGLIDPVVCGTDSIMKLTFLSGGMMTELA